MSPIQRNTKPKDKIFHYTYADRDISISPLRIILKETLHVSSSIAESNLFTQCEMKTFFTGCHKLALSACTVSQDRCSTFLFANALAALRFSYTPFAYNLSKVAVRPTLHQMQSWILKMRF